MASLPVPELPYDLQEFIVGHLKQPTDLLHLALTNRSWKESIIPNHLEYRILCVSNYQFYEPVWKHLAERPDLAARIHTVAFLDDFFAVDTSKDPATLETDFGWYDPSDIFPISFLDAPLVDVQVLPPTADRDSSLVRPWEDDLPIFQALRNMTNLQSFHWRFPDDPLDTIGPFLQHLAPKVLNPGKIFQALRTIPGLQTLSIEFDHMDCAHRWPFPNDHILGQSYSLWQISSLKTLVLDCSSPTLWDGNSRLKEMLDRLHQLENLDINTHYNVPYPHLLLTCTLRSLRRLKIKYPVRTSEEDMIVEFLQRHPGITKLEWISEHKFEITPEFLPHLTDVVGSNPFILSLISSETKRPLRSIDFRVLDEEAVSALVDNQANLPHLRRIVFNSLGMSLFRLADIGKALPQIVALGQGPWDSTAVNLDMLIRVDLFSSFPSLRVIWGIFIKTDENTHYGTASQVLNHLSAIAPNLRKVTIGSSSRGERTAYQRNGAQEAWTPTPRSIYQDPGDEIQSDWETYSRDLFVE